MTESNRPESISNTESDYIGSFDTLFDEIGEFGRYQIITAILTCLAIGVSTCGLFNFVFSAALAENRCFIPECESMPNALFQPDWLEYAVPFKDGKPQECVRYDIQRYIDNATKKIGETCTEYEFDSADIIGCTEIIVKNNEERLAAWLNIYCTENKNKLTFIGTANTLGRLVILPIVGIISDKFGRLTTIVASSVVGAVIGVIQGFSNSFEMYLVLEFLVAMANAGIISTVFIYNAEWTSPKRRVPLASINGFGNAIGFSLIGLAAMIFEDNFRAFKLWMSIPSVFIIFYFFVLRESPRWMLVRRQYQKAIQGMRFAAKVNGKSLTSKTEAKIEFESSTIGFKHQIESSFWNVMRRKQLVLRFMVLSLVWIFSLFTYYGVVLGSTNLLENKYVSYIVVGLAEIPGVILALFILDRIGRRMTVGGTLLICGIAIVTSSFLAKSQWIVRFILFLIGKATLTATLLSLYTYTSELWPTNVRNTIMNICSMLGRLGGLLATLTGLLIDDFPYLPSLLCGSLATLAAVLVLIFLPETLKKKLPDTIDEAIEIGNKK